MKIKEYHRVWCKKNGKDIEWLSQATINGFDVHHVDGDHENNAPENIVLIYSGDHFGLHNIKGFAGRGDGKWMTAEDLEKLKMTKGERAYKIRLEGYKTWAEIGKEIKSAMLCAKHYAKTNGLEWPIKLKIKPKQGPKKPKPLVTHSDWLVKKRREFSMLEQKEYDFFEKGDLKKS